MAFPKTVTVRGVSVPVDSWEELKGLIETFSEEGDAIRVSGGGESSMQDVRRSPPSGLSPNNKVLIERFVDAGDHGVPTDYLGEVLGRRGKGVRPALERWSRELGLVTQDGTTAFDSTRTAQGRGFRMTEHYRRAASAMLGR